MSPSGTPNPARFTREAVADLRDAAAWIAQDNPAAAEALRIAVRNAATLLGEHPAIGPVRDELASRRYRFLVLRGFPYVLVYEPDTRPPRILRVLHGARDLKDVLTRLPD